MEHFLKILSIRQVTHNVRQLRLKKPSNYHFIPGQATDVSINKTGLEKEKRPFTFTALNDDPYLEFTIKCYTDHEGITKQIGMLEPGNTLILDDPWGAISYQGEGYFIAGGAGITPFMAIFRQLHRDGNLMHNKLFFSNQTAADIIYENELKELFGEQAVFVLTKEQKTPYVHDYINQSFLEAHIDDFKKPIYICGPDEMVASITNIVTGLGASPQTVIFEK